MLEPENFMTGPGLLRDAEAYWPRRQAAWEATVVRKLCKIFFPRHSVNRLAQMEKERTDVSALKLWAFKELYPDCPYCFRARLVPYLHKMKDLGSGFTKSKLYEAWETEQENRDPCPIALVVPWAGKGTAVLYNTPPVFDEPGTVFVKVLRNSLLVIDEFPRFTKQLSAEWARDGMNQDD